MPSSMWRPPGVSCQCTSVCGSSANQSRRSPTDQMPDLLIQPPRLVERPRRGSPSPRAPRPPAPRARGRRRSGRKPAASTPSRGASAPARAVHRAAFAAAAHGRAPSPRPPPARPPRCRGEPPRGPRGRFRAARELGELVLREQRRMVLRVALDRQRPALDRVGEDHGRAVARRRARIDSSAGTAAPRVARVAALVGVSSPARWRTLEHACSSRWPRRLAAAATRAPWLPRYSRVFVDAPQALADIRQPYRRFVPLQSSTAVCGTDETLLDHPRRWKCLSSAQFDQFWS